MSESTRPVWVAGGGGVAGIAWEVGILAGLADEGVTVTPDAILIGTSAGAVVLAQVASGTPVSELYERQRAGVAYETSGEPRFSNLLRLARATMLARTPEQAGRRIGRLALAADPGPPGRLRGIVEARLPDHTWSEADLRVVVVDAESGVRRVITRADGVPLVDAVAASCAVPLASPPYSSRVATTWMAGCGPPSTSISPPVRVRSSRSPRAPRRSDPGRASRRNGPPWGRGAGWSSCTGTRPPSGPRAAA